MDGPKTEILVEEGTEKGRVLSMRPSKTIEIGREGNFRLEDPALSRRHCTISFDGASYVLKDEGSTWGTFVNDAKVSTHVLVNGDRIRIGNHILHFVQKTPPPAAAEKTMAMPRGMVMPGTVPALLMEEEDDEILEAAPMAAATTAHPDAVPPVAAPIEGADPDDVLPPLGTCANCGKPTGELDDGRWATESVDLPPRSYCTNCREQYPMLGKVLANHFCEKVLGAGGMGIVYRGIHVVMGRRSALKTLKVLADADPVLVQRLLREATAGGRIQHPNIVSVHDTGEQDQIAYVVMEYVAGENLAEAMRREKTFALKRVVHFGVQVAEALAAGFKLGYIHRDIKPENVLLMRGDVVKVTDFGLAKNLKEGELGGLTRTGQVLGTMLYMPPEQIVSSKGSDQRADIYSLGGTLFHLATGRPPLDSRSAIALLMDIRTKIPPPLSSLVPGTPPAVDAIVAKCLMKAPGDRYQQPADLAKDLRAALAGM